MLDPVLRRAHLRAHAREVMHRTVVGFIAAIALVACSDDTPTRTGDAGSGDTALGDVTSDVDDGMCPVEVRVCTELSDLDVLAFSDVSRCAIDCFECVPETRFYPCASAPEPGTPVCELMDLNDFREACRDGCADAGMCGGDCGEGAQEIHSPRDLRGGDDVVLYRAAEVFLMECL